MIPIPLARTESADRHLRWLVDQARVRLERAFPHRIAIVLMGSLARGEGTALVRGSRAVVLSDLDLAVVFRTPEECARGGADLLRLAREFGRAMRAWGLLGAVDLGAYSLPQLARLAARPGTRELKRSGAVISGDRGVLDAVAEIPADRIPREEALLLCENRLLEMLWAHPALRRDAPTVLAAGYAGGKAVLDGALAWLLCRGECPDGVTERLAAAEALAARGAGGPGALERLAALRFWTSFKLEPTEEALVRRYGLALAGGAEGDGADLAVCCARAWREGARHLLDIYHGLALGMPAGVGDAGVAPQASPAVGWERAARRAPLRRRCRRWLEAWKGRRSLGLDWAKTARVATRWWRGTPEHLLGATAAALVAGAPEADAGPDERRSAEGFARWAAPVTWPRHAVWETRRERLVAGWDRWVLRGARTGPGDAPWDDR